MFHAPHPVVIWLVEHCADVPNRYQQGGDGRAPYQRIKGRRCEGHILEFGCKVMFRVSGKAQGGLMQERWFPGIRLVRKLHTSESLVMKEDGLVVRSRAIREVSEDTWQISISSRGCRAIRPAPSERQSARRRASLVPNSPRQVKGDNIAPRRLKITRNVVEKLGP